MKSKLTEIFIHNYCLISPEKESMKDQLIEFFKRNEMDYKLTKHKNGYYRINIAAQDSVRLLPILR